MKAVEKFGSWLLDTKAGMFFGIIIALAGASITGYQILMGPKTVTLSESDIICTLSEPHGISARCMAYRRVR